VPKRAVELVTSATLPSVADRFAVPAASDVGKSAPVVPDDASCTRKYCPAASVQAPEGQSAVIDQLVPEAEAC